MAFVLTEPLKVQVQLNCLLIPVLLLTNKETFKPLGIFDNSKIKEYQKRYVKKYNAVRSLHSVNHIQCSINGKNHCISKQATFSSRSMGGFTNFKNGHIQSLGKQWGPIIGQKYGKESIKYTKTPEAIAKMQQQFLHLYNNLL